MNRFTPRPSQLKRDRHLNKKPINQHPTEPIYKIYWWRKTKPKEKTWQYFIGFGITVNRDYIYKKLVKVFGKNTRVYANYRWYVVELDKEYSWIEIQTMTCKALMDLEKQ